MQDGLYVALSSQIALEKRLNTIADNVANASTIGFRATGVKFEDVVSGLGDEALSFASAGDTYHFRHQRPAARDRQPVRLRHPGRRLVRHRDPGRHGHDPRRPLHHDRERRAGDASKAIPCSTPAARRSSSIRATARPSAGADGSLRQGDQLVGALGLFNFDPGAEFRPLRQFRHRSGRRARAGRRPHRRRRGAGLPRGIQRQSGAGDHPADHGAARLRETAPR